MNTETQTPEPQVDLSRTFQGVAYIAGFVLLAPLYWTALMALCGLAARVTHWASVGVGF